MTSYDPTSALIRSSVAPRRAAQGGGSGQPIVNSSTASYAGTRSCLRMESYVRVSGGLCVLGALVLLPAETSAQAAGISGTIHTANFCSAVEAQTLEGEPRHDSIMYQYQTLVYDAAGVQPSDVEEIVNAKVGRFIDENMPNLLCDHFNFRPRFGNILKLAVARKADPFLDQALVDWKVDVNQIDATDGATVLDYIERKREEAGSNASLAHTYQVYYNRFRAAGAKHAVELK